MYSLHYGPKKYEHSFLSWLQVTEVGDKSLLLLLLLLLLSRFSRV